MSSTSVARRWVARALLAIVLLTACTGLLMMNVRLDEQAHDLDQPMPCSSDDDIACRSGFVR